MNEYLVVYENAGSNWSAYVPDLPGCITTGETLEACKENIQDAISVFLEALASMGRPAPESSTRGEYVSVARGA